jgi:diaminopropionate ammonia-lyase
LSRAGCAAATREIVSWPGYAPTPLVELPGLAAAAGVAAIWYKDESDSFGLGSFKALGSAYGVFRVLAGEIARRKGVGHLGSADLIEGRYRDLTQAITVVCATDGNHGRAVAWGAGIFGCRSVVYLHAKVSEGRGGAIARHGARVVRVAGTYDDSVRQAALDAARDGWFVVSDTSYEGYLEVPRDVMQGYTVLVDEAMRQLPAGDRPSHAFVQAGVGGLAAAVCAQLWESWGRHRPRPVVAGESGVGGLAGLLAVAADAQARRDLGLDGASRVLVIGSEGDTDPELYRRLVGRTAEQVRAGASGG